MLPAGRPPHRAVRARFTHAAPSNRLPFYTAGGFNVPMENSARRSHGAPTRTRSDDARPHLAGNADNPEINHLLGFIRFNQGKSADGIALLKRAVSAPNATAEMHNNYGALLNQLGRTDEAIAAFNRALALKPNYVDALNNLGIVYREAKNTDAAIAAFKRAVELRPDLPHVKANLRSAYRDVVPAWHFAMMDDKPRNTAYRAAIARAVPGKRVLEIGTGAGLLAMMAARAGASTVTTCERVGLIADRARDIVALNGLATRVKVIGKSSA